MNSPQPGKVLDEPRFDVIVDPTDSFVIWDNLVGSPAVHRGRLLAYGTLSQAQCIAQWFNLCGGVEQSVFPGAESNPRH